MEIVLQVFKIPSSQELGIRTKLTVRSTLGIDLLKRLLFWMFRQSIPINEFTVVETINFCVREQIFDDLTGHVAMHEHDVNAQKIGSWKPNEVNPNLN